MKKVIKFISTSMIIALLLVATVVPSFAAGNLVINGDKSAKAKVGDVVTYELYLGDCKEDVLGLQAYLFYDKNYLEVDSDSLEFPSLTKVVSNPSLDNCITFNWTDVSNLADFSKSKGFVTVDFKVLKAGKTDISYFISELYGEDMTYLKNYTFTYNLKINDKTVIKDATPILNEDEENLNKYQGSFTNYADGKGEKNGSGDDHIAVTGVVTTDVAPATSVAEEVTKGEDNFGMILTIIGIVAVVIAIVIVIILRNNYNKRNNKEENKEENNKEEN